MHIIKELNERGYTLVLITSDYDEVAQYVKEKLGFKYAFGCKILYKNGKHSGRCSFIIDSKEKERKLKEVAKKEKVSLKECAYVGGDENDVLAMKTVGFSVAFNASDAVKKIADVCITNLKDVLKIFK